MPSDFSNWHNGNYSNVNSFQRSYKQKPPPGKTRNVERETGHVLRLEVLFCIFNFLLKTISNYNISARDRPYAQVSNSFSILEFLAQNNFPKAFLFWVIWELWRVFILIVMCIATLETSSFWTSSQPLASSTRSTTWRLVSLSLKA